MVSGRGTDVGDIHETGSADCIRAAAQNLLDAEELFPVDAAEDAQGLLLTGAAPRYVSMNGKRQQRKLVVPAWRLLLYRAFKVALLSAKDVDHDRRQREREARDARFFGGSFVPAIDIASPAFMANRLDDFIALADEVEADEELRLAIVAVARLAAEGRDPAEDVAMLVIEHRQTKRRANG